MKKMFSYTNEFKSHYEWLEKFLPVIWFNVTGKTMDQSFCAGVIPAHGDKCYSYDSRWEEAGIPFYHGVAMYLLTRTRLWFKEGGDPTDWIIRNYQIYKDFFPKDGIIFVDDEENETKEESRLFDERSFEIIREKVFTIKVSTTFSDDENNVQGIIDQVVSSNAFCEPEDYNDAEFRNLRVENLGFLDASIKNVSVEKDRVIFSLDNKKFIEVKQGLKGIEFKHDLSYSRVEKEVTTSTPIELYIDYEEGETTPAGYFESIQKAQTQVIKELLSSAINSKNKVYILDKTYGFYGFKTYYFNHEEFCFE